MQTEEKISETPECKALQNVYIGSLVECTKEEYFAGIRIALQKYAATKIDESDIVRATIALDEVKRLDSLYWFIKHMEEKQHVI